MQVAKPRNSWHVPDPQSVAEALGVDPQRGLGDKEVAQRRLDNGYNRLTPRKGKGPLELFLAQFHDPLIYILMASGIITGNPELIHDWVRRGMRFVSYSSDIPLLQSAATAAATRLREMVR